MMPAARIAIARQSTLLRRSAWLRRPSQPGWSLPGRSAMASARSDLSGVETPAELKNSARGRKRKLSSPPPASEPGTAPPQAPADASMQAQASTSAAAKQPSESTAANAELPRGQPLKDFVEQWEFRWDLQREAYPWEWGSDGRLSDGPHNIIRCALRAPHHARTCTISAVAPLRLNARLASAGIRLQLASAGLLPLHRATSL